MSKECPLKCICGAKQKDDGGISWKVYECLTFCHSEKIINRTSQCYETEIAQLKAKNEKLEKVAEAGRVIRDRWEEYYPNMTDEYLDPEELDLHDALTALEEG